MAGTGPLDLEALAEEFLAACVEALDTIPPFAPGLAGAPERSFVSPGLPAFDCCDQLTVHIPQVTVSPTSSGNTLGVSARTGMVIVAGLAATATRCLPIFESEPPLAADLQAAAEQINADAWALWNHVYNLIRSDQLFTLCGEVFWDGLRSINPSGGCGGWVLSLRVLIEGYEETL